LANVSRGKERVGWAVVEAMIVMLFAVRDAGRRGGCLEVPFFFQSKALKSAAPEPITLLSSQGSDISKLLPLRRRGCNKAKVGPALASHFFYFVCNHIILSLLLSLFCFHLLFLTVLSCGIPSLLYCSIRVDERRNSSATATYIKCETFFNEYLKTPNSSKCWLLRLC
jgi:hypothetical protein